MSNFPRTVLTILAIVVLVLACATGPAQAFSDVPASHAFATAVTDLSVRGIINGFEDGTFRPDGLVTRQQFAKMIVGALGLPVSTADICSFGDVAPSEGSDLYPDHYVAVAAANRITLGYADGTFGPYDNINRAHVITMVVRALGELHPGALELYPAPGSVPGAWGELSGENLDNAKLANHNGLLAGLNYSSASTGPMTPMPRAEVAQVLYNMKGFLEGSPEPVPVTYEATTVVEGLRIPWEIRFLPNGKLLVTEREGRVVVADVATGAVTEVGRIQALAQGEGGLMGLALDPDFPETPNIYVSYTRSKGGSSQNGVSRFVLSGFDTPTPSLGSETVLLDGIPAGSIHDGSRVAFGPDGYLWVTTGDSGNGGLAQRMDSLAGKVLRMTRDGQPAPGNPYLDRSYPFSLIFTLGHRNPQGLTFHPQTGDAYVTEHGPSDNDEVNRLQPGGNYGWPDLRGKVYLPGFIDPIMSWSSTIAPAGALFYSGDLLGALKGSLVFVTLKESDVRVLVPASGTGFTAVAEERVLFDGQFGRLRAIAESPDGALYVATSNLDGRGSPRSGDDRIIRIAPTP